MKPLFLVITGDGINCERETAFVLEQAGASSKIVHINDWLVSPELLLSSQGLVFPGGFSFGDELGSGQLMALKMRYRLSEVLEKYRSMGPKAILGICNGFQILTKLGLLPFGELKAQSVALTRNDHGRFIDRWVELEVNQESHSPWCQNLPQTLSMPVRHGEGRLVLASGQEQEQARMLNEKNLVTFRYSEDINGSFERIAGLCDPSGWVMGLMPHPEAASYSTQFGPRGSTIEKMPSFAIFQSIVTSLKKS
jgi:phosphoribosylformylglycinamidine synthase subunit PurQ / glutaminase